jgi:hypothetical protein
MFRSDSLQSYKESLEMHGDVRVIVLNFVEVILNLVMPVKKHTFKCLHI